MTNQNADRWGWSRGATIERRSSLDASAFSADFLAEEGRPVIVTDATETWRARDWSLDLFRKRFGAKLIRISSGMSSSARERWVQMSDYISYIEHPLESSLGRQQAEHPFYLYGYKPFSRHPELRSDFETPYFIDDWFRHLDESLGSIINPGWIMLGGAGTIAHLHQDYFDTHTWFAQLQGTKEFILFRPQGDASSWTTGECER